MRAFQLGAALMLAMALHLPAGAAEPADLDEATILEELSVVAPAPVPRVGRGAPYFSIEQTASFVCETELTRSYSKRSARRAYRATVEAERARRRVRIGQATQRQVEATELERQAAVRAMLGRGLLRPGLKMDSRNIPPAAWQGLVIDRVTHEMEVENGKFVQRISGRVRNTTDQPMTAPRLGAWAVDARGFILASQTFALTDPLLEAGESRSFSFAFDNPPMHTQTIRMAFGPAARRNYRTCESFPSLADEPGD